MDRADILELIDKEVERAYGLYGNCDDFEWFPDVRDILAICRCEGDFLKRENRNDWYSVLLEEFYEAFSETEYDKRVEELVQTAAVAIRIIEALGRSQ